MLDDAMRWRSEGPPKPLLRGDDGKCLGHCSRAARELLEELACAQHRAELLSNT